MANKLEEARRIINEVDAQMAELFVRRMQAAEMVFEHKKEHGLPILDQKREEEVVRKNAAFVEDELLKEYYIDHLKHLMSLSRAYQYRLQNGLKVAYSGVEGAFAHIAAGKIFPQGNLVAYSGFKSAYKAVTNGECDLCVLPIENSYAGEVGETLDLVFFGPLHINGVYELEVHQNLLALPGATLGDIQKVISHPQALSQCHDYIKQQGFLTTEAVNTALAAKSVAEGGDKSLAAIASAETAALYGLQVLTPKINNSSDNTTRFAVLSKLPAHTDSHSGTILMLAVSHETGSLANAISIIARHGYSMTALRSRPWRRQSWQYYFYIEIDGRLDNEKGANMLEELGEVCDRLKVAGTFAPHTEI